MGDRNATKDVLARRTISYSEAIARAGAEERHAGSDAGTDVAASERQAYRTVTTDEGPTGNVSVRMNYAAAFMT